LDPPAESRAQRRDLRGRPYGLLLALVIVLRAATADGQEVLPPAAVASTAAAPVDVTVTELPPEVYRDQYLFDDSVPQSSDYAARDYGPEPFGRRYLEIETGYYRASDDLLGDDLEQGVALRYGREMLNWGTIDIDASFADVESDHLSREASDSFGLLTVRHSAMPVSNRGQLFTTLGDQRAPSSPLLQNSYRMRLPTSMLRGFSSEVRSGGNGMRFSRGKTGLNQGIRMPRFESTGGELTAFSLDRRIGERFAFGAEMNDLGGDDDIRDHSSLLLGGTFAPTAGTQEHTARLLRDDDGNLAFWSDSRQRLSSAMQLRYGVFRFDPGIVWADLPINSDQQGLYLQADATNAQFSLNGGYDYVDYGLDAASLTTFDRHAVYFNGGLTLRRSLTLGLNSSFARQTYTGSVVDQQAVSRIDLYATLRRDIGSLRLDVFFDDLASDIEANRREREGAAASLDWEMPERVRLTTEVRVERNLDLRGDTRRSELSALLRYDLFDRVSFGLQTSLFRTSGATYGETGGTGLSADATWSFLAHWTGTATLYRNENDIVQNDFIGGPVSNVTAMDSFWLSVRYRQTGGQSYPEIGRRYDGTAGSGTLSGQVFFDENRDGIRQPSEEAAVGATVLLDGRYETRTDPTGFYSFQPVPAGEHEVIVLIDQLPLPWGLVDDTPRTARVSYRATATVNFPLTVIN
jgi:hypothetical protein